MRTALVLSALLAAIGAGVFVYGQWGSPEARACAQIADRCGLEDFDRKACAEDLSHVPEGELELFDKCLDRSDSCIELVACSAGSLARELSDGLAKGWAR